MTIKVSDFTATKKPAKNTGASKRAAFGLKWYGAKICENVIQALARVVISQAFIRIVALGYRIVGTEHDSLWILIPKDGKEKWHIDRCLAEVSRTPEWLPGIPLAAECN